jgi:hypothetical protein
MSHEGQESVINGNNMYREQERAFLRNKGRHISYTEGILRSRILKRKPFFYFKAIWGFKCFKILWNNEKQTFSVVNDFIV